MMHLIPDAYVLGAARALPLHLAHLAPIAQHAPALLHAASHVFADQTGNGVLAAPTPAPRPADPTQERNVDFASLGTGLKSLISAATGVLTLIATGFFGLCLAFAVIVYAWHHNNPRKLQEAKTSIFRILEAAGMFFAIGLFLGLVHTIVSYAG